MKQIIIIGASYLQVPLIVRARELGLESHVFAWEQGAVGRQLSDRFYPISIVEKERILEIARRVRPSGVVSIASDLAMPTVTHVAGALGLIANSRQCTEMTTDKLRMRLALSFQGIPCPRFALYEPATLSGFADHFPVIVKPTDRSGSRGVTRVDSPDGVPAAAARARSESFSGRVIVEEFLPGREISVESISWGGRHYHLACTDKETTGAPFFVEIGQHQPADLSFDLEAKVVALVDAALTALRVEHGASHTEILITPDERLFIIEVAARMGGDQIGARLVELSTGYDFVEGVIMAALGEFRVPAKLLQKHAGIYYLTPPGGKVVSVLDQTSAYPEVVAHEVFVGPGDEVRAPLRDSAQRCGYFIYRTPGARWRVNQDEVLCVVTR